MKDLTINQIITQLKIKLESKNLKTIEDLKNKLNKEEGKRLRLIEIRNRVYERKIKMEM